MKFFILMALVASALAGGVPHFAINSPSYGAQTNVVNAGGASSFSSQTNHGSFVAPAVGLGLGYQGFAGGAPSVAVAGPASVSGGFLNHIKFSAPAFQSAARLISLSHPAALAVTGHSTRHQSQDSLGNFNFGYNEQHTTGGSSRQEAGGLHGVRGSYTLNVADGRKRLVNYVADGLGFRAAVSTNEPGIVSSVPANAPINAGVGIQKVAVAAPALVAAPVVHTKVHVAPAAAIAIPAAPVAHAVNINHGQVFGHSKVAVAAAPVAYGKVAVAAAPVTYGKVAVAAPVSFGSSIEHVAAPAPIYHSKVNVAAPAPIVQSKVHIPAAPIVQQNLNLNGGFGYGGAIGINHGAAAIVQKQVHIPAPVSFGSSIQHIAAPAPIVQKQVHLDAGFNAGFGYGSAINHGGAAAIVQAPAAPVSFGSSIQHIAAPAPIVQKQVHLDSGLGFGGAIGINHGAAAIVQKQVHIPAPVSFGSSIQHIAAPAPIVQKQVHLDAGLGYGGAIGINHGAAAAIVQAPVSFGSSIDHSHVAANGAGLGLGYGVTGAGLGLGLGAYGAGYGINHGSAAIVQAPVSFGSSINHAHVKSAVASAPIVQKQVNLDAGLGYGGAIGINHGAAAAIVQAPAAPVSFGSSIDHSHVAATGAGLGLGYGVTGGGLGLGLGAYGGGYGINHGSAAFGSAINHGAAVKTAVAAPLTAYGGAINHGVYGLAGKYAGAYGLGAYGAGYGYGAGLGAYGAGYGAGYTGRVFGGYGLAGSAFGLANCNW